MTTLLKQLIDSGEIVLYHDYRSKTLRDLSLNGYHGLPINNPIFNNDGIYCPPGQSRYVSLTAQDDFNFGNGLVDRPFSLGIYCKIMIPTGNQGLIGKYTNPNYEYAVNISANRIYFFTRDKSELTYRGRYTVGAAFNPGSWIFIVATYDGSGLFSGYKIYLNGNQIDNTDYTSGGSYIAMENTAAPLDIGGALGNTYTLQGGIRSALLVNRVLLESEIIEIGNELANRIWPAEILVL